MERSIEKLPRLVFLSYDEIPIKISKIFNVIGKSPDFGYLRLDLLSKIIEEDIYTSEDSLFDGSKKEVIRVWRSRFAI